MLTPTPNQLYPHNTASGTLVRLWRYPVKSMLGEQHEYLDINKRGVEGDRLFAIRTVEGKFASGKSTRRFRRVDGLFGFRAAYHDDIPEITFPDGQIMQGADPSIHTLLSNTLGQPVTLANGKMWNDSIYTSRFTERSTCAASYHTGCGLAFRCLC